MLKIIVITCIFFSYSFSDIFFIGAPDARRISNANKSNRIDKYLINHIIMNNLDTIIRRAVYKKNFYVEIGIKNNYSLYKYIKNNYKKVNKLLVLKGYKFEKKLIKNQLIYIINWN